MTAQIERRAAPSLFGSRAAGTESVRVQSLLDLMHDGFYALFMLKNGSAPPGENEFLDKVSRFLAEFESEARRLRAHGDDIDAAKYAYCAALDETILASAFPIRAAWERRPLQLTVFGDQLAGAARQRRRAAAGTAGFPSVFADGIPGQVRAGRQRQAGLPDRTPG
jgi:type VI secretion system protein ImpK